MKENYPEAMEVLKRLFGDANKVKMSLYSQLDLLPVAPDRTRELRNTLESVDCICRQLRSLGENVDQPAFVMVIEKKFPQAIILKLQKQKAPDERWKPTNFRRELEALIYGREQAERTCAPQGYGNQASSQQCQPFHEKVRSWQEECWLSQNDETKHSMSDASAASDASEAAKSAVQRFPTKQPPQARRVWTGGRPALAMMGGAKWAVPCIFCDGSHFHDQCPVIVSISDRQQLAREQQLCLKCLLTSDHTAQECTVIKVCFHCRGLHNSALCDRRKEQRPVQQRTGDDYGGQPRQQFTSDHQGTGQ
jgi:hypothetical protein